MRLGRRLTCSRRPALGLTVLAALLLLAPAAVHAQSGAEAWVDPATAAPGQDLDLVFRVPSPQAVEATVQEEVTCTVTFPSGQVREPCSWTGSTATVHVAGSGERSYVFPYQAPAELGTYEVAFQATSTLRIPASTYEATTSFQVVPASADTGSGANGAGDGPGGGDGEPGGSGGGDGDGDGAPGGDGDGEALPPNAFTGGAGGQDGARMLVSTTMALGVIALGLVANRWPLGGGP